MEENEKKSIVGSILKIFIPIAIVAAIVIVILNIEPEEEIKEVLDVYSLSTDESKFVLENDQLKFTLDSATTQFELKVKDTGAVWYSNPQDIDSDTKALPADKSNLNSTLMITYGNMNGVWTNLNNYSLSVEKGIYDIEMLEDEDAVKVNYTIGNIEPKYIIPIAVPEDRMNEFLDKMEKKPKKQILEYYRKYDIEKLKAKDDKDALLLQYPDLEEHPIYALRDNVKPYLKAKIEEYFAEVGYTEEDYEADLARYSQESSQDIPIFNVSVVYRLEGGDLVVEVPYEDIDFKSDYPLTNVEVLPYFGAGGLEDEGYIIVPESGGCVIRFNNQRYDQNVYYSNVYGWDYCTSRKAVVTETRNAFPMFAISKNGNSFMCLLEDGASFANINADVSGRNHNFNHASAGYSVLHYEAYDVGAKSSASFYVFENEVPQVTVKQRYRFVDTDSYVKLANEYGEYLVEKYPGLDKAAGADTPMVVDVIESVDKVQQKLGVPKSAPFALTTYDQTVEIADSLNELGIDNFDMKISGWMNDGYTHTVLTDVDYISELGGKKKFKNMISSLTGKGIDVYLDGQTEFAYNSGLTDGFVAFRDAARFNTRENAELRDYSIVYYGQDEEAEAYYLLRPQYISDCFNTLTDFAKEYGVNVSLRNTGYILNSDFNPKNLTTREKIIGLQRQDFENAKNSGSKFIINYGNDYAIEYADTITNMDISNTNNAIIDFDIPFYQIAIHDKVNYVGDPINMAEDAVYELLKSAEYGAGLQFQVMASDSSKLQDTKYTCFYGADFSNWKDSIGEIYNRYNSELSGTFDKEITDHYLTGKNVRVTEYENGTKVYVNYGYENETVDGVEIPSRDYVVK